jgi:hypothetical protein
MRMPRARTTGSATMPIISATEINQFAATATGRERLAEVIRNLVYSWLPSRVRGIGFLSGETNNFPGWDGWVRVAAQGGLEHRSVWEISVRADAPEKIREDFVGATTKRMPDGWDRASTTYVAVTGRSLKDRHQLESELRTSAASVWQDVQIIDAIALEEWIEKSPTVQDWLAAELGLGNGRFGSPLIRSWTRWSGVTQPPISSQLVLAGRDTQPLVNALKFDPEPLFSIQADSPDEAVAIVFSVISQLEKQQRELLLANALVITNSDRAVEYAEQPRRDDAEPLTILVPPATAHAQLFVRNGHRVVIASGKKGATSSSIKVVRGLRRDFEEALTAMGVHQTQAATDARACGSSVSIWRAWKLREFAQATEAPEWASGAAALLAVPAVLARSWNQGIEGDRSVLEMLAERKYSSYRDAIHAFASCDTPLFEVVGDDYNVVAPSFAYALVGEAVVTTQVEQLEKVLLEVFGAIETDVAESFGAEDEDDRIYEPQKAKFSSDLRDGLAETLLAIAFLTPSASHVFSKYGGGEGFATHFIRNIPSLSRDGRIWASMRDQIPLLAEAAPIPFVEALESLLQGGSHLDGLFSTHTGLFSRSYLVGVLWGLEVLAWSEDFLFQVTAILLQIQTRFRVNERADNAARTLHEIYLAWNPGTTAAVERRIDILKQLSGEYDQGVWHLLLALHPRSGEASFGTRKPTWRDFGRSKAPPLTRGDVAKAYRGYVDLAIELASNSIARLIDLVQHFSEYGADYREKVMLCLSKIVQSSQKADVKDWERLREFIAKHRSFSSAPWALKEADLAPLEAIASDLQPTALSLRVRWLFDDLWPEVVREATDYEGRDRMVREQRDGAIKAMLAEDGVNGIERFTKTVKYPHLVGSSFARIVSSPEGINVLDVWARDDDKKCGEALRAASGIYRSLNPQAWPTTLFEYAKNAGWREQSFASSVLDFPPVIATFDLVAAYGVGADEFYWRHAWLHAPDMDSAAREVVTEKLLEYGRGAYLLDIMHPRFSSFGARSVYRALRATVEELLQSSSVVEVSLSFDIVEAMKWARQQPDISPQDIAALEYPLVRVLTAPGSDSEQLVLHRLLASDPDLFIEFLCKLYRAKHEPKADAESNPDESRRVEASIAWHLLRTWKTVPGLLPTQEVDKAALDQWFEKAISAATEKDRKEVALLQVGQVLYHCPRDPSTSQWPQDSVCGLIERAKSRDLENGFSIESTNSRGPTSRSPLDGGRLERSEASTWINRAAKLPPHYRRCKALFRRIAEGLENQAKWEDGQAQRMRMRWS